MRRQSEREMRDKEKMKWWSLEDAGKVGQEFKEW